MLEEFTLTDVTHSSNKTKYSFFQKEGDEFPTRVEETLDTTDTTAHVLVKSHMAADRIMSTALFPTENYF